jgi:hypothetical protein
MAKRGRPLLQAQTLEAALQAVAECTAPRRPRNDLERIAGGRTLGRPRLANSPTRVAAQLADYLMQSGSTRAEAIFTACSASPTPVNPSNVRKCLKQMHPTVTCTCDVETPSWLQGLAGMVPSQSLPLFQGSTDAE